MENKEDVSLGKLSDDEISRYARHLSLPEIGIKGQKKLKSGSVLCIGCGGLGSPILIYLAAAGIGRIGIVDLDLVEDSNLQRQIIHSTQSIGKKKINSAKEHLKNLNPFCKIEIFDIQLTSHNALEIIKSYDVICDCTDNFPSRYLINDACVILKKPNIYGSVAGFEGQASVFNLTPESPNYRDLMPEPPPNELIPNCSQGGVMGILPGIIGLIQATEAIKIIAGVGTTLNGRILVFNALKMVFKELHLKPIEPKIRIDCLIDYNKFCSQIKDNFSSHLESQCDNISIEDLRTLLKKAESNQITLIDVRQEYEFNKQSIKGAKLIPLNKIKSGEAIQKLKEIASQSDLYIYCQSGKRSLNAVIELKKSNIHAINILGGLNAWGQED